MPVQIGLHCEIIIIVIIIIIIIIIIFLKNCEWLFHIFWISALSHPIFVTDFIPGVQVHIKVSSTVQHVEC